MSFHQNSKQLVTHLIEGRTRWPQKCIFCDDAPLSGEHLFSDWIGNILPKTRMKYSQVLTNYEQAILTDGITSTKKREGDFLSRKIDVVCVSCNGKWMSILETEAIPVLTSLIKGERRILTPKDQETITTWASLKCIIGDFDSLESSSISMDTIRYFYKIKSRMLGWQFFIGNYCGDQWGGGVHFTCSAFATEQSGHDGNSTNRNHFRSYTFTIGNLIIHVISTDRANYEMKISATYENSLYELKFLQAPSLSWPPKQTLSDMHLDHLQSSMVRFMNDFKKYG